jgi:pimeloyl-ACP methyl ester carboxylesterase
MIGSSNKGSFSKYDVSRLIEKWSIPGELTSTTNWYRATFSYERSYLLHCLISSVNTSSRSLTNPRSSDIMRNNITIPVKMIFGVNDPYFAPGMQYTTATRVNNYELVEFNDATHWITHEKPDAVNAEIEKFLNKRSAISLGKSTPNNAQDEQSATEIKAGQKAPTAEVV